MGGGSGGVAVIDVPSATLVTTLLRNEVHSRDFAVSPDCSLGCVYFTSRADELAGVPTISGIDRATLSVVDAIPVPRHHPEFELSPDGTTLYLAYGSSDGQRMLFTAIDVATKTVIGSVDIGALHSVIDMALSDDGSGAYVTHFPGNIVTTVVVDLATVTVIGSTQHLDHQGATLDLLKAQSVVAPNGTHYLAFKWLWETDATISTGRLPLDPSCSPGYPRCFTGLAITADSPQRRSSIHFGVL